MFCPGDELTPLPRPGRVCSHGAAVTAAAGEGSGREGDTEPAGSGHPMARGEGSAAQGHSSSPFPLRGLVSVRMRAATEELPARPRPEAALGGRREAAGAGGEGTPRVTALPSAPPSCSPSLRGHQGTPGLLPASSLPPPLARPHSLLSAKSRLGFAGMLLLPMLWDALGSSPPLAVLPFALGLRVWQNLGLGWWGLVASRLSGGVVVAVTAVTLCRVRGG